MSRVHPSPFCEPSGPMRVREKLYLGAPTRKAKKKRCVLNASIKRVVGSALHFFLRAARAPLRSRLPTREKKIPPTAWSADWWRSRAAYVSVLNTREPEASSCLSSETTRQCAEMYDAPGIPEVRSPTPRITGATYNVTAAFFKQQTLFFVVLFHSDSYQGLHLARWSLVRLFFS